MALHRSLDGEGPQPLEYFLSRLCEEFSCLPSEAVAELLRAPVGLLQQIIECRAYERFKALYDAADTPEAMKRLPQTDLMQLVKQIDLAIVNEDRKKARRP